jgi:hypothetical protein
MEIAASESERPWLGARAAMGVHATQYDLRSIETSEFSGATMPFVAHLSLY